MPVLNTDAIEFFQLHGPTFRLQGRFQSFSASYYVLIHILKYLPAFSTTDRLSIEAVFHFDSGIDELKT